MTCGGSARKVHGCENLLGIRLGESVRQWRHSAIVAYGDNDTSVTNGRLSETNYWKSVGQTMFDYPFKPCY